MKNVLMASLLVWGTSAFATGGFSCDLADDGISFNVNGVTSHGFGSAIVDAQAHLATMVFDVGSSQEVVMDFSRTNVSQYWNSGKDFKLLLYKEADEGSAYDWTQVTIETVSEAMDGEFRGTLKIFGGGDRFPSTYNLELPLTCYVE